jgi:microcystin-dependent protein
MATLTVPYSFAPATNIVASEMNSNFAAVKTFVEGLSAGTNLDSGSVTSAKILDSSIITSKINDLAVTTGKINDLAVASTKIADGAITTAKINDLAVAEGKLANGAVAASKIATSAVEQDKIKDGAVVNAKIASATIAKEKLATSVQNSLMPTGAILPYAGSAPLAQASGWLVCDGSAVSRTTYAALYAAINVQYGSGDGSTTFNLPDLRGRVIAGVDVAVGGTTADRLTTAGSGVNGPVVGAAGGSQTHTLDISEIPSHTHGYLGTSGATSYTYSASITGSYTNAVSPSSSTTGTAGGGGAHRNVQPTLIMYYIIKT